MLMLSCYVMSAVSSLAKSGKWAESLMRTSNAVHNHLLTGHGRDGLDFAHGVVRVGVIDTTHLSLRICL